MSLIYTKVIGYKEFRLFCEGCGDSVGTVEGVDLVGLSASGVRVFCFECDGVGKDEYPEIFRWEGEPYILNIDGHQLIVDWPKSAREQARRRKMWEAAFATTLEEIAGSKTSCITLSSSTEVHKSPVGSGPDGVQ